MMQAPLPPVEPGGLMTLDLSSVVGWAYGHPGSILPRFGSWRLDGSSTLGARFVSFENELIAALEEFRPKRLVMEAPLPAAAQASTHVARQQFGLAAYTEGECHRQRVTCREARAGDVRKGLLGQPLPRKSEQIKAAVIAFCAKQGWHTKDHNAADALMLWLYTCRLDRPTSRGACDGWPG